MLTQPEKTPRSIPAPALVLGLAGLIPFAACSIIMLIVPEAKEQLGPALTFYGAAILSFLGGIRWGFAVIADQKADWNGYGLSVVPSLVAWVSAIISGPEGLLVLAIALALWLLAERSSLPGSLIPAWFFRLRILLTVIAVMCLTAAALAW